MTEARPRAALVLVALLGCSGASSRPDPNHVVTCGEAAEHGVDLAAKEPELASMVQKDRSGLRHDAEKECQRRQPTQQALHCMMAAEDLDHFKDCANPR